MAVNSAKALTPADQAELDKYTLTESLWQRYKAAALEAQSKHLEMGSVDVTTNGALSSLNGMTAEIEKKPEVTALLRRHNLSTREVVLAGLTLLRAQMTDAVSKNPKLAKYLDSAKKPSEANMKFFYAHQAEFAELQKKSDEADDQ